MEWSRPEQQGVTPETRAGHSGVTIGEYWFISGGGNSRKGKIEISYMFITSWLIFFLELRLYPISIIENGNNAL